MQAANWSIDQLPGLSQNEQAQLKDCGISTTKHLLKIANNPQSKEKLALYLQVNLKRVNKWIALADLARIPSVGCQYCGLLLHSGIVSVAQLTQTPASRLHKQILRLQIATMQRKDLCPSLDLVQRWTQEARVIG